MPLPRSHTTQFIEYHQTLKDYQNQIVQIEQMKAKNLTLEPFILIYILQSLGLCQTRNSTLLSPN